LNYLSNVETPDAQVLQRMSDQLDQTVPDWKSNFYRLHTPKIALLTTLLYRHPNLSARWMPKLLAKSHVAL
jgi:hypothetical protein